MGCIGIVRSSPMPCDEARLTRVFREALRTSGSSNDGERAEVVGGVDGDFHFVIRGKESLDCHVYSELRWHASNDVGEVLLSNRELRSAALTLRAVVYVEGSPLPDDTPVTFARVAYAAAGLLDDTSVLIWDLPRHRLALCTPESPMLLRSDSPTTAFERGVAFPPDIVTHNAAARDLVAVRARGEWGTLHRAWESGMRQAIVRARDLRWVDVNQVEEYAAVGVAINEDGSSGATLTVRASEVIDWAIRSDEGRILGLFGAAESLRVDRSG